MTLKLMYVNSVMIPVNIAQDQMKKIAPNVKANYFFTKENVFGSVLIIILSVRVKHVRNVMKIAGK
jgi:hypothetical protein